MLIIIFHLVARSHPLSSHRQNDAILRTWHPLSLIFTRTQGVINPLA